MKNCVLLVMCGVMLCGIAGAKGQKAKKSKAADEVMISETKLPEKVRATFVDRFPNAVINKMDSEKEGGVTVWDLEFRDGQVHKETDIADDGTMLEYTVIVTKKTIPKQVLKKFEAAAKKNEAAMSTMERIEVSYETKSGKVVKLPKSETRYAMEMIKDKQTSEIVVDDKGKVIEEPTWEAKATEKKSAS